MPEKILCPCGTATYYDLKTIKQRVYRPGQLQCRNRKCKKWLEPKEVSDVKEPT